ncbi:MAG: amidohydrolase family protein [Candidatus Sphingomonas colombiensis]|nr:amidohydrolase family protein [Sphingomonas sp.]WEK43156.1 MAG: amidohydrolase family protein [Sphingomonas sp.]
MAAPITAQGAGAETIIHAGHLIDGLSKTVLDKVSVVIRDGRIVSVQPGFIENPAATVIDLANETVLPGLIDSHVHITQADGAGSRIARSVMETPLDIAFQSVPEARRELEAGFTSIRNLMAPAGTDIALKRAIEKGLIPGPRMWVSGMALSPTGGHADPAAGLIPELARADMSGTFEREAVIDGPESARRAVRLQRMRGADLIKLMVSGGVISLGDDPQAKAMADDEVAAAVATAHALGMKVAAHAHGKKAIDAAVRLGVDSIEHGTFADAESYALMKAHGVYLVPTLLAGVAGVEFMDTHPGVFEAESVAKAKATAPVMVRNLAAAYRAGVKIAFGTDMSPHGVAQAREFVLMVDRAGMSPMDAILAATGNAADLLGAADKIGSVRAGRYADIIAVSGDPLADIGRLQHVNFVMKNGVVVVDRRQGGTAE